MNDDFTNDDSVLSEDDEMSLDELVVEEESFNDFTDDEDGDGLDDFDDLDDDLDADDVEEFEEE